MTTYAVKWREPDGGTYVGRLELGASALRLAGRAPDGPSVDRQIGYDEVRGLRIGREREERVDDRPALVVDRAGGSYRVTSAFAGAGVLHELADRLAALQLTAPRRATVVLPLRDGALERVRELVAQGPPFDPASASLTRHHVLLTESEAIFVFESDTDDGLASLLGEVDLWAAASAWRDVLAGPPRLAEPAYSWERPPSG